MLLVLKTNFLSRSRMLKLIIRAVLRRCLSWMASQGIIKLRCTLKMKAHIFQNDSGSILLHSNALWLEERWCNLSMRRECDLPWAYMQDRRMLCWWYRCEKLRQRRSSRRPEKSVRHYAGSPVEDEPKQVLPGVASGKFLGFVVTSKGIHLNSEKICAVQEMQLLSNLKEFRGLQGWSVYIRKSISNLSGCCKPFTKLMKKGISFVWDSACQQAFEEIKECLTHSPILIAPVSEKPLLLYVWAIDHSLRALLAQNNDENHEQAIYYLSRIMIGVEHR